MLFKVIKKITRQSAYQPSKPDTPDLTIITRTIYPNHAPVNINDIPCTTRNPKNFLEYK